MMDKEFAVCRCVRTEYGKKVRKAYENHTIQEKRGNMTKLEPRTDGISNTLTTVQKDNLILERTMKAEKVGIRQATAKGYIECEIGGVADFSYPTSKLRRGRVQGGGHVCPTLTSQSMGICRIEKFDRGGQNSMQHNDISEDKEIDVAKVGQVSADGSQCGSVYSDDGNAPTLTAGTHGDANSKVCTEYRIRKLTPKECWRLMDFTDEDFHKAEKVNSNTQLYKQAGNSIVVNVLVAILGQLFSGKEDVYKNCKVKAER